MVTIQDDNDIGKSTIKLLLEKATGENRDYFQFSSIISFEGKELASTINKDRISYMGLSPQSKVASQFKPILRRVQAGRVGDRDDRPG